MSHKNLRYRRDYVQSLVSRFERAVENYAFLGTIPCDSQAAMDARTSIIKEYHSSKTALKNLLDRLNRFS